MKINIHSNACKLRAEIREFVQRKVKKLRVFYNEIISIEVSLKVDKAKRSKFCTIRLVIPGHDMLSSAQATTFESATAQAVEALQKQIEKRKTKLLTNSLRKSDSYPDPAYLFHQ